MSLKSAQLVSLLVATVTMGLMAGVFGVFAHAIMPGLGNTSDRTFSEAFEAINKSILNPLFMLTLMGALVASAASTVLYLRGDDRSVLPWVIAALALYGVTLLITFGIHVPLNNTMDAAEKAGRIASDPSGVRDAFHETRWDVWNVFRALLSTAAFCCLAWALVLHGRSDPPAASSEAGALDEATSPTVYR
jgi:uncharacterized membrane protein